MSGIPAGAGSLLGKRLGKYEILALLALGGTAEIYLARIEGTAGFEKYVVVKCLHDHLADDTEFVKMFLDEARLAAMLDHSNIVQTFELGEHENRYYMVMEFLAGLSLAMVVRRAAERLPGGRVPVPLVLNIAQQACAGLHYAHEKQNNGKPLNMVHRDISPQNLVIGFEGVVKVVDFGIARADQRDTKTKAGTIKGKFAYMSPEQCVAANIDRRTDVFALGVIMWELFTAKRLFKRNSPYETYQAVIECNVPKPSTINHEIDAPLDQIVMKAVAKDKEQRYPTAEALGDAILGHLHQRGKGSSAADVGRFIEAHFNQEIEEHGERMRELISNRAVDAGPGWDDEDEDKKKQETVDIGGKGESLDTGDLEIMRGSEASLDNFVNRLQTEGEQATEGEDELPPDKTRIEQNPYEKLRELEAASKKTPVPTGSVTGGPAPLPAPPTVALGKKVSGVAAAQPMPRDSGRFPDLANMQTQIADSNTPAPAPSPARTTAKPELAPTALGAPLDPRVTGPVAAAPPHRATQIEQAVNPPASDRSTQQETAIPNDPRASAPGMRAQAPTAPPSAMPMSYPVMQGGRPISSDLAPSAMPSPQRSPYQAPPPGSSHAAANPQQAANLMSPVGDRYAQHVDWDAAAARPAKAIPPWMLAALFLGVALGVGLIVMIISKIAH
jgi:serine/threonine-protein kinase